MSGPDGLLPSVWGRRWAGEGPGKGVPGQPIHAGGCQYAGKDKAFHHHLAPHHLHRKGGQVKPAAKAGGKLGEAKRLSWGRLEHNTAVL